MSQRNSETRELAREAEDPTKRVRKSKHVDSQLGKKAHLPQDVLGVAQFVAGSESSALKFSGHTD